MHRQKTQFGRISCIFATLAVAMAVTGSHFNRIQGAMGGYALRWFDDLGWVSPPNHSSFSEWRNPGLLVLTDPIIARWLTVNACWFAAWAMLFAMWAESQREATLPLSAGFVLGAMAFVFLSPMVSIGAMLAGGACMVWLRRAASSTGAG